MAAPDFIPRVWGRFLWRPAPGENGAGTRVKGSIGRIKHNAAVRL
jgi:hypothetical protein